MTDASKNRTIIRQLIASITPVDDKEQEDITFALRWIDSGAEIFRIAKPDDPKIHLVAYFVLFDVKSDTLLLVDHRKAGLWLPPGGHIEVNEHPQETVKREAQEELGIEADFQMETPLFVTVTETVGNVAKHTDVSLWYLLNGQDGSHFQYDTEEFHQVKWFSVDQIPHTASEPHLKKFINKVHKYCTLSSYDATALKYAEKTSSLHPKKQIDAFIGYLPRQAEILDLGCGPGRDAKIFAELGFAVTGIDLSPKMIELAKETVANAKFQVMDFSRMEFSKNHFDGIWASAAFLHAPKSNISQIFRNIHSLLKLEGIFYLSLKQGKGEILEQDARYGNVPKFWSFFDKDEIVDLLEQADFEILQSSVVDKNSSYHTHEMIHLFCKKRGI